MKQSFLSISLSWGMLVFFGIAVQWLWGWGVLLEPWLSLSFEQILTGFCLLFLSYIVRAWRLHDYFYKQAHWKGCIRLILLHNFLNNMLPARTGELSFPLLMKRYFAIKYMASIPALLWFRLLDLYAISSMVFAIFLVERGSTLLWIVYAIWLCIPLLVIQCKSVLIKYIVLYRDKKWGAWLLSVLEGLPKTPRQLWGSWLLSILNWVVKIVVIAWFMGLLLDASWDIRGYAAVAGEMTSVLPIHAPGGFGTYESGMMAVLTPFVSFDIAGQAAVNTHLLLLSSSVLAAIVGWCIPCYIKKES